MRLTPVRHLIARETHTPRVVEIAATHRTRRGWTTVDLYLVRKGVDAAGRKRWSSAFGRLAAKLVRADGAGRLHDTWILWRGRVRRVFAHTSVSFLDTAWVRYADKIKEG